MPFFYPSLVLYFSTLISFLAILNPSFRLEIPNSLAACKTFPFLALKLFKESGLLVYKSQGKNVEENIALYLENKLDLFTPLIQFNTIKGSACGSCTMSSCGPEYT